MIDCSRWDANGQPSEERLGRPQRRPNDWPSVQTGGPRPDLTARPAPAEPSRGVPCRALMDGSKTRPRARGSKSGAVDVQVQGGHAERRKFHGRRRGLCLREGGAGPDRRRDRRGASQRSRVHCRRQNRRCHLRQGHADHQDRHRCAGELQGHHARQRRRRQRRRQGSHRAGHSRHQYSRYLHRGGRRSRDDAAAGRLPPPGRTGQDGP